MSYEFGIGAFVLCVILSRVLSEKALKVLSSEEKASLVDAFSNMRAYNMIPLALIMGGYWIALKKSLIAPQTLEIVYWIALSVYIFASLIYTQVKLNDLGLPKNYTKRFSISRAILFIGLGVLIFSTF